MMSSADLACGMCHAPVPRVPLLTSTGSDTVSDTHTHSSTVKRGDFDGRGDFDNLIKLKIK